MPLENNDDSTKTTIPSSNSSKKAESNNNRSKRSLLSKSLKESSETRNLKSDKPLKPSLLKMRQPQMSESRLHSSYHKPSVSVMNDIPAEMYFDGAGFLRYEDDSEETTNSQQKSSNYDRPPRINQDNNRALKEFRQVFNISKERELTNVKYDDDVRYPESSLYSRTSQERAPDHGAQATENETPIGMDFLNAYQREMLANMHNYAQMTPNPTATSYQDPFSFTYPNLYNAQPNFNQMTQTMVQQEPLIQNHRLQSPNNVAGVAPPTVYASSSSQPIHANSGYVSNLNYQQYPKIQRKKRSLITRNRAGELIASASEPNQDFSYSRLVDQQDSSSGFIPITGSFNGGTIQLNFPVFGGNPSYSSRPPVQAYHTYSVPMQPEGRPYRNTMERFYHPSEARRYSYGVLGSGNFEVIRGGVFPGERHQGFSGGYQGERVPSYNNDYDNYGTTEIILDGPIQGFQGFDNFPAHLINALSKHSELAVHPDRREAKGMAS